MVKEIYIDGFKLKKCLYIELRFELDGTIKYYYAGRWRSRQQVLRKQETVSIYHRINHDKIMDKKFKRYSKNKTELNKKAVGLKKLGLWKNKRPTPEKAVEYVMKYYNKNKLKILKVLNKRRSQNKEKYNEEARQYRLRKNPTIGLARLIGDFKRGNIDLDQFNRRIDRYIELVNEEVSLTE